jgi:transcription elongation factor Elf1
MSLDTTTRPRPAQPRYFNPCAQCGEMLMAPDWSEHVNERCVRHLWTCESCGYHFETTVFLGTLAKGELTARR